MKTDRNPRTSIAARLVSLVFLLTPVWSFAKTITISPPSGCASSEEFENVANSLQPGDELILRGGVYCQTGARRITARGTEAAPIIIRAADGETPVVTRNDDPTGPQSQNGIEITGEYLVIRGIHFKRGDAGVRFMGGSHHITLEDCEISNTSNNAINMNSGNTDSFIIRRNHIHDTGLLDSAYGGTEGEGMYIGCHSGSCQASNHLIEGNYIHHLRGTSVGGNDGIEIKMNSYGNIVRDNVIHDTTIGARYPGIFVYGVSDPSTEAPNIVEGNVIWNSGEAILVTSDAIVRNNIVMNSDYGIVAQLQNPMSSVRNVTIVNNTLVGSFGTALRIRWSGASNMVLTNNAIYNPGGTAADLSGLSGASISVKRNYVQGSGASIDNNAFFDGGSAAFAFVDSANMDVWPAPNSILRGVADASFAPALDFNATVRTSPYDVGAYETEGLATNPGWAIAPGFKDPPREAPCLLADTDLFLEDWLIDTTEVFEACDSITVGPNFRIAAGGDVTFRARNSVILANGLVNGFSVDSGAMLTIQLDPLLGSSLNPEQ